MNDNDKPKDDLNVNDTADPKSVLWSSFMSSDLLASLRNKIADRIWIATENYEMGATVSCGNLADVIIDLIKEACENKKNK